MSVTRLPSGRWRAQVYHEGRNVSVSDVLEGPKSFATKTEAKQARAKAREILAGGDHLDDRARKNGQLAQRGRQRIAAARLFRHPRNLRCQHPVADGLLHNLQRRQQ